MEWRTACGITSTRPEIIRRTLTPAHEELCKCGYLQTAEFQGRGQKQLVAYAFGVGARDPDPDLVERLVRFGVVRGVAAKLTLDNAGEYLHEQLARYEAMLLGGLKPRLKGALLVDLIKNPGKYADPEGYVGPRVLEQAKARVEHTLRLSVEEVETREERHEDLAAAVAVLLRAYGLIREDLLRLPPQTLRDLRGQTLGRPQAEREGAALAAKAMLSAL